MPKNMKDATTPAVPPPLVIEDGIFFKVKNRYEKIRFADMLWVQAKDIYAIIRTTEARYLVSHSLGDVHQQLPDALFERVHRSYVVNLTKIDAIEDRNLLVREEYIPVGDAYKEALFQRLRFMP